jgi:hypothetical protein
MATARPVLPALAAADSNELPPRSLAAMLGVLPMAAPPIAATAGTGASTMHAHATRRASDPCERGFVFI